MNELNSSKINDFDDIYNATKESQGYTNAVLAIRYVLFDDLSVFEGEKPESNKYLYISSTNNARKKAMLLQQDDLAHILIKYCMQSFGLRGKDFSFKPDEFEVDLKRIERLDISPYETIERVAYAAMHNVYTAYTFLYTNEQLLTGVVEYMIEERYVSELKEALDNFSGIIDNKDIKTEVRYAYYNAYNNLDDSFAELKRNDPDYVK